MTKTCAACKVEKDASEFYPNRFHPSGLRRLCKPCGKAEKSTPEYRRSHALACRRARAKDPQKHRDAVRAHADRGYRAIKQARQDPYKARARRLLRQEVRAGRIIKPEACTECGWVGRLGGHHADYSKPLDVEWLCYLCHSKKHVKY